MSLTFKVFLATTAGVVLCAGGALLRCDVRQRPEGERRAPDDGRETGREGEPHRSREGVMHPITEALLDLVPVWPVVLACADLGTHVVDLWEADGGWSCGNDDRSVVVTGAPDADAALDDYRHTLALMADYLTDDDAPDSATLSLADAAHALGECSDPACECHD